MNDKEKQIIALLQRDARISLVEIAKSINMPISTVHDKIKRFEQKGLIQGYSTKIDFSQMGLNHRAKIAIKVPKLQKEELIIFLQKHAAVNFIHEINGGFDLMIETSHKDIKEYLTFVDSLKDKFRLENIQEFQVIDEIMKQK